MADSAVGTLNEGFSNIPKQLTNIFQSLDEFYLFIQNGILDFQEGLSLITSAFSGLN